MERWLSGRKQLPAKKLFGKPDRGFESHPLRQYSSNAILMAIEEYIFEECWIRRPQRSASFRRRRKASAARGGLRKISVRKFICRRIPPSPQMPNLFKKVNETTAIQWQIPEYEYQPKDIAWRWLSLIAAIILFAFAIWQKNFLFAAFVFVAFLVINYLADRFPAIWEIKIDEKGIEIKLANSGEGKKFYSAENIEGFDIHAETDNSEIKELAIKFKSKLSPLLKISFYSRDELKIKEFLLKFAPEEEISQSAIDSFLKLIRF